MLKQAEGMPAVHNKFDITSEMLNKPVERFKLDHTGKGKERLQFQFKGSQEIYKVVLERPPLMSQQMKNEWLDLAANTVGPIQMRSQGMGLGE